MLKRTYLSAVVQAITLATRFMFIFLLMRFSEPSVVGLYSLAVAIESVVLYLFGLEFHTFVARRYAHHMSADRLRILLGAHKRVLYFTLPTAVVGGICVAKILALTSDLISLLAFGSIIASGLIALELGRYLVITGQNLRSVTMNFLRIAAWQPVAMAIYLFSDANLLRLILISWSISSFVAVAWGVWSLREILPRTRRPRTRYILIGLKQARVYWVLATFTVIQGNLERFIIQLMLGPSAVGVFSFYTSLSGTLGQICLASILGDSLPSILKKFRQNVNDRFTFLTRTIRSTLTATIALSILICAGSIPLISYVTQSVYSNYLWMLPVLLFGQICFISTQPIHLALYAAHQDRTLIKIVSSTLFASVVLNIGFIPAMGIAGAVMAPTLSNLSIACLRYICLDRLKKQENI